MSWRRIWAGGRPHPLLFAAFPVLFLYAHNLGHFSPSVIVRPLLVVEILALVLWAGASLVYRSVERGALLAGVCLLLLFLYGPVLTLATGMKIRVGSLLLGPNRVIFPVAFVLLAATAWGLARSRRPISGWTRVAATVGLVLMVMPIAQIALSLVRPSRPAGADLGIIDLAPPGGREQYPDVFWIILDGYGGPEVLSRYYSFDNSEFLDQLEKRGFSVARKSRSNYCQTALSLAATLSLEYLDSLAVRMGPASDNRAPLRTRIQHSRVARSLERLGYTTAAFATGYYATEARTATHYLAPRFSLNEFEQTLLASTPLPPLLAASGSKRQELLQRERILFTLDHLSDALSPNGPVFVLAHVVAPHPPFVFGPEGEMVTLPGRFTMADANDLRVTRGISTEEYQARYIDQVRFVNKRVLAGLDQLLAAERRPIIVIIQGDHGPGSRTDFENAARTDMHERFTILNACRFPEPGFPLPDDLSPVNTFRMVFDRFFGASLELLPNRSLYSTHSHPYDFLDVTGSVGPPS